MSTPHFKAPGTEIPTITDAPPVQSVGARIDSLRALPLHRPYSVSDGANVVHWRATDHAAGQAPRCEVVVTNRDTNPPTAVELAEMFSERIGAELTQGDRDFLEAVETEYREKLLPPDSLVPPSDRTEFDGLVLVPTSVEATDTGVTVSTVAARFSSKRAVQRWMSDTGLLNRHSTGHMGVDLPPMPTSVGLEMAVLTRHGEVLLGARNDAGKAHDGYVQTFPGGTIMERYSWDADGHAASAADTTRIAARQILADELGMPHYWLTDRALDQTVTPVGVLSSFGSCHRSGIDATGVYSAVQAVVRTEMSADELIAHYSEAGERDEASGVVVVRLSESLIDLVSQDEPVTMRQILATSTSNAGQFWHLPDVGESEFLDTPRRIRPNSLSHLLGVSDLTT